MKLHTILPVILGVSIFLLGLVVYSNSEEMKYNELLTKYEKAEMKYDELLGIVVYSNSEEMKYNELLAKYEKAGMKYNELLSDYDMIDEDLQEKEEEFNRLEEYTIEILEEREEEDNHICATPVGDFGVYLMCDSNGDEFTPARVGSCRPESYSVNGKKQQYCSCPIEYTSGKYKGITFWQYKDEKGENYIRIDGERFYLYPETSPPCANDN